ncbi:MAG: hypothetical protein J1F02_10010 [Lachnospiraceae bacterium]|nr:hypothetical protein [Lachnospiraceae bacterium]
MRNTKKICKQLLCGALAGTFVLAGVLGVNLPAEVEIKADAATVHAATTEELTAKRGQFTKQFAMSDGSFTAATYSMPVH